MPTAVLAREPDHTPWRAVGEGLLGALGMMLAFATPLLRGRRSHWGLDEATAARDYPGDDLVEGPRWQWTHGIEIDAPTAEVWPWVAQIGQDRAGFYSYEFLENIAGCRVHNADAIHPEWQQISVGDALRMHPRVPPLPIRAVEPGRYFVAAGALDIRTGVEPAADADPEHIVAVSWLFFVEPLPDGRTRLISRFRTRHGDVFPASLAYGQLFLEPMGFVMDRRMLLGVKERVEQDAGAPTST